MSLKSFLFSIALVVLQKNHETQITSKDSPNPEKLHVYVTEKPNQEHPNLVTTKFTITKNPLKANFDDQIIQVDETDPSIPDINSKKTKYDDAMNPNCSIKDIGNITKPPTTSKEENDIKNKGRRLFFDKTTTNLREDGSIYDEVGDQLIFVDGTLKEIITGAYTFTSNGGIRENFTGIKSKISDNKIESIDMGEITILHEDKNIPNSIAPGKFTFSFDSPIITPNRDGTVSYYTGTILSLNDNNLCRYRIGAKITVAFDPKTKMPLYQSELEGRKVVTINLDGSIKVESGKSAICNQYGQIQEVAEIQDHKIVESTAGPFVFQRGSGPMVYNIGAKTSLNLKTGAMALISGSTFVISKDDSLLINTGAFIKSDSLGKVSCEYGISDIINSNGEIIRSKGNLLYETKKDGTVESQGQAYTIERLSEPFYKNEEGTNIYKAASIVKKFQNGTKVFVEGPKLVISHENVKFESGTMISFEQNAIPLIYASTGTIFTVKEAQKAVNGDPIKISNENKSMYGSGIQIRNSKNGSLFLDSGAMVSAESSNKMFKLKTGYRMTIRKDGCIEFDTGATTTHEAPLEATPANFSVLIDGFRSPLLNENKYYPGHADFTGVPTFQTGTCIIKDEDGFLIHKGGVKITQPKDKCIFEFSPIVKLVNEEYYAIKGTSIVLNQDNSVEEQESTTGIQDPFPSSGPLLIKNSTDNSKTYFFGSKSKITSKNQNVFFELNGFVKLLDGDTIVISTPQEIYFSDDSIVYKSGRVTTIKDGLVSHEEPFYLQATNDGNVTRIPIADGHYHNSKISSESNKNLQTYIIGSFKKIHEDSSIELKSASKVLVYGWGSFKFVDGGTTIISPTGDITFHRGYEKYFLLDTSKRDCERNAKHNEAIWELTNESDGQEFEIHSSLPIKNVSNGIKTMTYGPSIQVHLGNTIAFKTGSVTYVNPGKSVQIFSKPVYFLTPTEFYYETSHTETHTNGEISVVYDGSIIKTSNDGTKSIITGQDTLTKKDGTTIVFIKKGETVKPNGKRIVVANSVGLSSPDKSFVMANEYKLIRTPSKSLVGFTNEKIMKTAKGVTSISSDKKIVKDIDNNIIQVASSQSAMFNSDGTITTSSGSVKYFYEDGSAKEIIDETKVQTRDGATLLKRSKKTIIFDASQRSMELPGKATASVEDKSLTATLIEPEESEERVLNIHNSKSAEPPANQSLEEFIEDDLVSSEIVEKCQITNYDVQGGKIIVHGPDAKNKNQITIKCYPENNETDVVSN